MEQFEGDYMIVCNKRTVKIVLEQLNQMSLSENTVMIDVNEYE